ncbi:MAG: HNH endonuclease signature motif containing protein [Bacteroidota bacterium]
MAGRCSNLSTYDVFEQSYIPEPNSGCWLWLNFLDKDGYGFIRDNGIRHRAHRYSFLKHKGEIPKDNVVCHKCDNPTCVNPDHLFIGTKKDNTQDMLKKGRNGKTGARGEMNPNTKLKENDIINIVKSNFSNTKLSRIYDVSMSTIARIKTRQVWAHVKLED